MGKFINYKSVVLSPDDLQTAFKFYENACGLYGYAQDIISWKAINQENVDEIVNRASEMGFDAFGSESDRELEKRVLELESNTGMPIVFTSYYGNKKLLDRFGIVIVRIALYAPRYMPAHDYYRQLAPTPAMLSGIKDGSMSAEEYLIKYNAILASMEPLDVYNDLIKLGKGKSVAIMCYERPPDICHRHYVTEWMKSADIILPEFPFV